MVTAKNAENTKQKGFCVLCVLLWLTLLSAGTASAATRYVWQDSPSPAPPYTNWATAAHVIQDAVDAAVAGDAPLVEEEGEPLLLGGNGGEQDAAPADWHGRSSR